MEYFLPQGHNLMEQLNPEVGVPHTATRLEPVEGVVVFDGNGEAAVENHRHHLPDHLHEAYAELIPSPFWYQDHRLPGRLLHKDYVS